jgi:sugar transferase (PEP-CTERM/EpsH1 system associated)
MNDLLFLAHRIPYPPNKGDKIRSFHVLKELAIHYRVHLAAFVDNSEDWKYVQKVKGLCYSSYFARLDAKTATICSMLGLVEGTALTIPYYRNRKLKQWVSRTLRQRSISKIFVFSSSMAQYVIDWRAKSCKKIIDFVDVDSAKWAQYGAMRRWPANWVYKREARKLQREEARIAREFDISVFVSKSDAELFVAQTPDQASRVAVIQNGVDTEYFAPSLVTKNPYPTHSRVLVFTGAMNYWANVDAVVWFARNVFPLILRKVNDASFYIVGSCPGKHVKALAKQDRVYVTGGVSDIRPYIAHADLAVAPLRIGRGIQNKVIEAMALARPVLSTPLALEGIGECQSLHRLADNSPEGLARKAVSLLMGRDGEAIGQENRRYVLETRGWQSNLLELYHLMEAEGSVDQIRELSERRMI